MTYLPVISGPCLLVTNETICLAEVTGTIMKVKNGFDCIGAYVSCHSKNSTIKKRALMLV